MPHCTPHCYLCLQLPQHPKHHWSLPLGPRPPTSTTNSLSLCDQLTQNTSPNPIHPPRRHLEFQSSGGSLSLQPHRGVPQMLLRGIREPIMIRKASSKETNVFLCTNL